MEREDELLACWSLAGALYWDEGVWVYRSIATASTSFGARVSMTSIPLYNQIFTPRFIER